jgi:hypothetical protein
LEEVSYKPFSVFTLFIQAIRGFSEKEGPETDIFFPSFLKE